MDKEVGTVASEDQDGLQAVIFEHEDGYDIGYRDVESGEFLPTVHYAKTFYEAKALAERALNRTTPR